MTKFFKTLLILSIASFVCFAQVKPNSITKEIVELDERGAGKTVGTVTVTETANGVSIDLENLESRNFICMETILRKLPKLQKSIRRAEEDWAKTLAIWAP